MTQNLVEIVKDVYRRAVATVAPANVLAEALTFRPDGRIAIGDWVIEIDDRPVFVVAFGKAACEMTAAVESILGERIERGIAVTKVIEDRLTLSSTIIQGSHPVPDERSLDAGSAVLQFVEDVPRGAVVLCLISGGGSSLMESLRPGVSLTELQDITRALLNAGASIDDLNAVRARLSEIKAGGLLARLGDAEVINLVISDVLGDDLSTIASGPTVPRASNVPAEDILRSYKLNFSLPDVDEAARVSEPRTLVLANLSVAIDAACDAARSYGLEPVVLSRSLRGESRHVAGTLASIVADIRVGVSTLPRGSCVIAGGETTVTVSGDGIGGRNTEGALSAAMRLQGVDGVAMGFLATDGDDAETNVAGGIVTGETVNNDNRARALQSLDQNDTLTFLTSVGAAWGAGSTGTNVNDLVIGVVR